MKTDAELKHDVWEELKWEPGINETGIGIAVHNGVVTLSGHVETFAEKIAAENAVKRVGGVKGVVEELEVKLIGTDKITDEEIAQAALNNLKWNASIPQGDIMVKVENGWLTLEGEVRWNFQREAAKKAIENLKGIRGIGNLIKVKSSVHPSKVSNAIRKSFERNAIIDAEGVKVTVDDHKVILSGTVRSWAEHTQAAQAAWSAPGVWSVENNLIVTPMTVKALTD